jgi:hypothetical protein
MKPAVHFSVQLLRERLGLPPPSTRDAVRLQRIGDEVMDTVIAEDQSLRHWISQCRRTFDQRHCDRDVFGDCNSCDRRHRKISSTTER